MKQTITIDVDVRDGYELKYNPETRTIEEIKKEPIRSKSWEKFCKHHPNASSDWYIDVFGKIFNFGGYNRNSNCLLKNREDAEGILALIQLTRLHDEWVGDWKGDYSAQDTTLKYQIVCSEGKPHVSVHHIEHSLLDFPNEKIAEEFLDCFKNLIEKAKRFI